PSTTLSLDSNQHNGVRHFLPYNALNGAIPMLE
ncbi:hypothetical protein A2U01_0117275, partial [Trifolium medium]|nr:hypothetical protein [Trifolium medium]